MPGPIAPALLLLTSLLRGQTLAAAAPPAQPARPFGIGSVNLLSLTAALPSAGAADAAGPVGEAPMSLRTLRESADRLLERDVKAAVLGARLRESGAQWSSVSGGATGPRSADLVQRTVQNNVSPPTSFGGDGWAGLLTALIPASAAALSSNPALADARACLSFLQGYEGKIRAFRDGLPATDEAATPELLLQWERLSAELRANASCRGRGPR